MQVTDIWELVCAFWVLCGVLQLYYWLRVFAPLAWHRGTARDSTPPVSVIVCVNKMTGQLAEMLNALGRQNYPACEVIVVNDGGDRDISQVIRETGEPVREVVLSPEIKTGPGKKPALALGIRNARHDWLLLTDADCLVSKQWVRGMIGHAEDGKRVVLGYGPLTGRPGWTALLARYDNVLIAMQYLGHALAGQPYMGVGRNLLYHRSLFDKAGAFSGHAEIASGDDDLFVQAVANKQNTAICLDPETFAWSPPELTIAGLVHQKRRHLSTSPRYRPAIKATLFLFAATFVSWWIGGFLLAGFDPSPS
ncbi:MAG: glycosyltransferase, partial [Saprospiraceae bacterium]|nr:glycosyltransferase [Saprospiraceae bacterium]